MALTVAINGFGRIGRAITRAAWGRDDLRIVHVNDLTTPDVLAWLLARDTVHGRWHHTVEADGDALVIDGARLPVSREPDPAKLPWAALGVDVVLECTGVFRSRAKAALHLDAGAKRVLLSAPGKGADATVVYGVNQDVLRPEHAVVSCASCTTNALAPVLRVLHDLAGVDHGWMTTVHAYTMDQNLLDGPHKKGLSTRSRAAAQNIVPTTTGAAQAIGLVMPELDGRLEGMAIRVPVPDGSLIDLTARTERPVTQAAMAEAFRAAASHGPLAGLLGVSELPLVSSDVVGDPHASLVDLPLLETVGDHTAKVLAWYDNEWGFSQQMIRLALHLGALA